MLITNINTKLPFHRRRTTHEYVFSYACISRVCSCDLDLDPTTLIYELEPDIPKATHVPKVKFLGQDFRTFEPEHNR